MAPRSDENPTTLAFENVCIITTFYFNQLRPDTCKTQLPLKTDKLIWYPKKYRLNENANVPMHAVGVCVCVCVFKHYYRERGQECLGARDAEVMEMAFKHKLVLWLTFRLS